MFEKLQFWKKSSSLDSSSTNDFPVPDFSENSSPSSSPFGSDLNSTSSTDAHKMPGADVSYPTGLESPSPSFSSSNEPVHDPFAQSMNNASSTGEGLPSSFNTPSIPQTSQPQAPVQQTESSGSDMSKRDVELILSRLDLIKSEIENMQHRMIQLEQEVKTTHQNSKNNVW